MSYESPRVSLPRLVRDVLLRRRRVIAVALAVPLSFAVGAALFLPRTYRSTAVVVVDRGGDASDDDIDARLSALTTENMRRSRLFDLVSRFKPYRESMRGSTREPLVDQMQKDINIEVEKEDRAGRTVATAVRITYSARSPQLAADVANELASFYEREDLRLRVERARYTTGKLKDQLGEARARLDEQEARIKDFKMRNLNELPEQVGLHLSELAALNSQMRVGRGDSDRPAGGGVRAPEPRPYDERLDKLAELRTRYTDQHPEVKLLKREIAMNPFPHGTAPTGADRGAAAAGDSESASARAESTRRAIAELQQKAAMHEQGILNAPFRQQELDALLPDYIAARNQYQTLWEKYQIAQMWDPRHDGGRIKVLDPAVPRRQAVAPSVPKILAIGIAAALALAGALVFLLERLDTSFHTAEDLRVFTRVPVLASVPRLVTTTEHKRQTRATRLFTAKLLMLIACTFASSAVLTRGAHTLIAWIQHVRL